MTNKDDDPGKWLAAQFVADGDDASPAGDGTSTRRASDDESTNPDPVTAESDPPPRIVRIDDGGLPLRRPGAARR